MGFWSTLADIGKEAGKRASNEIKSTSDYKNKSDEELNRIAKDDGVFSSSSSFQRNMARGVLNNRDNNKE